MIETEMPYIMANVRTYIKAAVIAASEVIADTSNRQSSRMIADAIDEAWRELYFMETDNDEGGPA